MNNSNDSQPLAPIAPFHLSFQPGQPQPQTPGENKRVRRKSEHTTPLLQQPLSPDDTTPVLKTQPTIEATLVKTPAPKIFDQENCPPPSVSAKRGVLVQPRTPKTPKPKSLSLNVTDFEPFVFKLLGRLRYPNWRRLGMEINGLDHEELMRVFSFFLALFDENLGYVVEKNGFSKAFAEFRASFRQIGFALPLTKRNFLNRNKKPVLPFLKMVVDKVIQKYGSVEKLCRSKFDYESLLQQYAEKKKGTEDAKPTPSLKRRRRQSMPNDAGRDEDGSRRAKRRRTSDATGLISARKQSTSPSPVGLRSNSDPQPAKGAPVVQPVVDPPSQAAAATTNVEEDITPPQQPSFTSCSPFTLSSESATETSICSPPSCAAIEEDVEMQDTEPDAISPVVEVPCPENIAPMDVDDGDAVEMEEPPLIAELNLEGAPPATELVLTATNETEETPNRLLVEKDMIIQEQAMQIEKLGAELQDKMAEIASLVAEKTQLENQIQVTQQNVVNEKENITRISERLEAMENEKRDREAEKQELWEKISKTSDQYQATLQQKEDVINDLMNQVSTLKLQLAQTQQVVNDLQLKQQKTPEAMEQDDDDEDDPEPVESVPAKVTVIGKIDFRRYIEDETLAMLRVVDLQKYLKANGLDTKGRKRDLVARVRKHFSS